MTEPLDNVRLGQLDGCPWNISNNEVRSLAAEVLRLREALRALHDSVATWNEAVEGIIGRQPVIPGAVDAMKLAKEALGDA